MLARIEVICHARVRMLSGFLTAGVRGGWLRLGGNRTNLFMVPNA